MRSVQSLTFVICLLASIVPAWAQEPVSRCADVRRVTRTDDGRVEEAKGLLVSDPQGKEVRFEIDAQAAFAVPYDRIIAMHYEKSVDPSKWGWPLKGTNHYLAIHYADSAGQARFVTLRLSERDVPLALDALETDTGLIIDRTLARQSFLGIPIRAAIGDRVTVTDRTGQETEGTITELSASSLVLDGSTAAPRVFDGVSVKSIRHTRSRERDAARGFGIGALIGGIAGGLFGRAVGGDARSTFEGAAVFGAIIGGIGAVTAAVVPSQRFRATRDVYLGGKPGGATASAITIVPQVEKERKAVAVSVRF